MRSFVPPGLKTLSGFRGRGLSFPLLSLLCPLRKNVSGLHLVSNTHSDLSVHIENKWSSSRSLILSDWTRFSVYADRVKSLRINFKNGFTSDLINNGYLSKASSVVLDS